MVLPTYNEAENLPIVIYLLHRELTARCELWRARCVRCQPGNRACLVAHTLSAPTHLCSGIPFEVVVVDDASPDGTQDVAAALAAVYGEDVVRLAPRPGKLGLGASPEGQLCAKHRGAATSG